MTRRTRASAHGLELYDLTVFEAVARLGSIGGAARALGTVQPGVTARIQRLEAELGTQLFERHTWGVSLTRAGERLLPYAQRIANLIDLARDAVRQNDEGSRRPSAPQEMPNSDQHKAALPDRKADQPRAGIPTVVSPSAVSGPGSCQRGRRVQCQPLKP